jgi:hypothetical protein
MRFFSPRRREQLVENFRRKFLKSRRASAVISHSKPEAWRSSVPHAQVSGFQMTEELCREVVRA